jgi:hypothetical protein
VQQRFYREENAAMSEPMSGAVPVGVGLASYVRIPIPGTNGLAIELNPPSGWKGKSTSSLFFHDKTGKRTLRLDYGPNKNTGKSVNYHWNQKGTTKDLPFDIKNHQLAGQRGAILYRGAKYFKYAGRSLLVVGAGMDAYSIVVADKPMRRSTEVVSAWAMAWVGCKTVGSISARVGTLAGPEGTAIGGIGGCIVGGFVGYSVGEKGGEVVYDWAEDTVFRPVPTSPSPLSTNPFGYDW